MEAYSLLKRGDKNSNLAAQEIIFGTRKIEFEARRSGKDCNIQWLKCSLQQAINLELATMPPYLTVIMGGKEKVNMAVGFMLDLKEKAQELMDIQIPGGTGETYGPCWRYVNNDSH